MYRQCNISNGNCTPPKYQFPHNMIIHKIQVQKCLFRDLFICYLLSHSWITYKTRFKILKKHKKVQPVCKCCKSVITLSSRFLISIRGWISLFLITLESIFLFSLRSNVMLLLVKNDLTYKYLQKRLYIKERLKQISCINCNYSWSYHILISIICILWQWKMYNIFSF